MAPSWGHLGQAIGITTAILASTQGIITISSCWVGLLGWQGNGQNVIEQDFWSVYITTNLVLDVGGGQQAMKTWSLSPSMRSIMAAPN